MALSKEDQERIKKRWESRNGGSTSNSTTGSSTTKNTTTSYLNDSDKKRISERWANRYNVDENYVNTFINDTNSFFNQFNTDYSALDYNSATSDDALERYKSMQQTERDLKNRAQYVRHYLAARKDDMDEETYKSFSSYLDNLTSNYYSQQLFDARDFYSQWDSEESYQTALAQMTDYEEKKNADLGALQSEIDALETVYKEAEAIALNGLGLGGDEEDARLQEQISNILSKAGNGEYSRITDLEKAIDQKTAYLNQAKVIQKGIELASVADTDQEFSQYSAYVDGGKTPWYKIPGYEDIVYGLINGDQDAKNGITMATAWGKLPDRKKARLDAIQYMTDEEKALYNYYYNKHGYDAAEEYLDSIIDGLNQLHGADMFQDLEGNRFAEMAFGVAAGFDQANSGLQNLFSDKDYIPTSATQYASGMVREDFDTGFGKGAYDLVTTTANMLPSIMVSVAVGAANPALGSLAGNALMGASAAGNAYASAINSGYDKKSARFYSTCIGASEVALGQMIGGISKLGGITPALEKALSGIDSGIARFALQYGGQMVSEGIEEGLQEILDPLLQNAILNADEDIDWSEVAYSALLGGLSAGLMEGPGTVVGAVTDAKLNKNAVKQYGEFTGDLIQEGLLSDPSSESYKLAEKFQKQTDGENGKAMSGYQIRQLVEANDAQFAVEDYNSAVKTAKEKLTQLGETKDVDKIAELAAKKATGQELTRTEKSTLARSQYGAQVAKEMVTPTAQTDSGAKAYNVTYKSITERVGEEGRYGVAESGETTVRNEDGAVTIAEVSKIEDGQMTVKLDDGREVYAGDIDFASEDESRLYSAVADMENMTPAAATALVHAYDSASGQSVTDYVNGIDEAYTYGYYGYSEADLKAGNFTPNLTSEQMMNAYRLGQSAKKIGVESKNAQVVKMRTAAEAKAEKAAETGKEAPKTKNMTITYNEGNGKVVDFDKAGVKLSSKQKAAPVLARVMHDMGLGTNFELFSSYLSKTLKDENGKPVRVFLNDQGVEEVAYSGVYRKSDGTIRIDLNAYNGRQLTLNAMAHELTHFIQQWSTEKYEVLAEFLVNTYEKTDMTMHERVLREQARLERIRKKDVSYDEAYDEVVANAMSKMLDDGKVMEKLTELQAKDASLAKKLWEGLKKLLNKFFHIYSQESALFHDAADLMELKAEFEQLQQMWAEAFVEASENFQAAQTIGFEMDMETESVSPAVMHSEHTWTESDYVQERNKAAEEIAKAIGVSVKKAKDYIDSINSIAKMIAEDRSRLDYFSSPGRSSFVDNSEYGGSFDFSTLCKKRRLLTGTFTAIQKALPNTALTADEILDIRNRMKEANLEVSCGLCYVEGSRANMGQFAKEFLRLYKQYYPDAWQPNMADVNTPDGIEWVRINHPECYEQYEYFWNHYGTLKDGDKNLFASQQKPKLYQLHTEYKGEILNKFKNDDKVEDKNINGGIRLQSFSDFEIVHLIDTMQIIMDMSRVGLAGQAYTKVPDFAWALGDTGLKINLSLIAKGVDADGKLIFDDVEGMPIADAMKLRERYSKNVGTILVAFNDEQLLAAMADERVDFIIPFHRSQWKKSQYGAMGLPAKTKDYTFMQNEKYIKPQFHEYRGRMVKDKATNYMPNEYWDFSKSGKENAEAYLEMCARNNKRPKFYKLLTNNGDGSYSLKADGSTDGYWKLLIDFKMYDNEGNGSPQLAVKPEFNMEEANRMLETYKGGHSNFPVAQGIVDDFVKDYKASHKGEQYSSQETDADSEGFKDYDIVSAVYAIRNEKAKRGHDLVKVGNMPTLYRDLFDLKGDVFVSNEHLYQNMVSRATAEADGRFNKDASADYHELGEEKVINAIEQFQDPLVIMESLKDYDEPRLVAILDEKGNDGHNLLAVMELYAPLRPHGVSQLRNHVLITIYEKNSLPDYIEKTVDKGRILHIKEGSRLTSQADLQLVGEMSKETLKKNVARFNKKVKAFKAKNDIQYSSQETDADYIRYDRRAILKESKVDEYLDDYAAKSSPKYAQAYIAYVRPRAFLKLTTDDMLERYHIADQAGELDAERLSNSRPGIYLRIDHETGKVTGHEGRHRMAAMGSAGIELVPVLLLDTSNKMSKTDIEQIYLHGQFDETAMEIVRDLIPLSYENRDRVVKNFATQSSVQRIGERYGLNKTLRFSSHETDNISNRDLLANAFEGVTMNSNEYKLIQEYKSHVAELNSLEEKLSDFNREIRKIRFTEGEYDAEKLRQLESEANKIAKAINQYDKKLLSLEASEPLRKVIERERKKEAQKTRDHVKEIQQNKKARAEQAELRQKIRKKVRDLNKLLNRGNKKLNVKEDMKGFVSKALELADYLFTDHISNDELIRKGIDEDLVTASGKAKLVHETDEILSKLYDHADSLTDEEFTRLDAKRKANEDKLRDLLTAQRNRRLQTPVYNLFSDLVTEYSAFKNSSQDAVKAAYNPEVERFLRSYVGDEDSDRAKALKNMRVADMTTEELWKLDNAYQMVLHAVRTANKLFVNGKAESIEQVVNSIAADFSNRKIPEKDLAIVAQKLANKIGWNYEKLYYALDRIGSEAFTELFMNLANSENIVMQDVMEAAAFRDQMVEKYGHNNWALNKKIDTVFMDNTGKHFRLTLGEMMALYAYSRREGAYDHLEYGGFMFGKEELKDPNPANTYKLNRDQLKAITDTLTIEQKAYAEEMQKYLSEVMGEKGNEVSTLLYGIKMFGEKNYFPIHVSGVFKAQAQESQAKAAEGFQSMSNAGFTHAQNSAAKAPIILESFDEVWSDHVNEMSRYHGAVPALEDIRRVMNRSFYSDNVADSTAIKQLMINKFGNEAAQYFDNLYREANSGAITDKLQQKSKKLLSLFRKNSVAYSASVLVQQPASIVRAYAMIDRKYFGFKGVGAISSGVYKAVSSKWNKAYENAYNEMLKYAPGVTMTKEIGGFDTATGGSIRSYLLDTDKSFKQKWKTGTAKEKGMAVLDVVDDNPIANLPNVADKIAWIEIWNACKKETLAKHKDLAPTSDEFMKIVGDRFTEVIRATQVYDSIFAKSPMLKSKNIYVQMLVSFMNEPNTVANMAESALRDFTKGNRIEGLKKAHVLIHSIIFTGVLKSIIYAMRDDDEDETYIEKYIEALTGSLMDDFWFLNYIPFVRDVWSVAQGYDVERTDMAIVSDAIGALNNLLKAANTDKEDMTEDELIELDKKITKASWDLVDALAAFTGIPMKNVRREINAIIDHAKIASANAGKTSAMSAWDTISEAVIDSIPFMGGKSKTDKLYAAIIEGDTEYIERMKATYKTEDSYHNAVRKALRENDPRIKEAAQAHIDGDPSKRVQIAKQIIADGFILDDVVSAINSEINAMTTSGSDSGAKKEKGVYTAADIAIEAANGDWASVRAIKDDIIQTAQKNGKTKDDAEDAFASSVQSEAKEAYLAGSLNDTAAKKLLVEYAGKDEDDATETVRYWSFCKKYPAYSDFSKATVGDYYEFAEPAGISVDVYARFINGTKGLATIYDEWGDEVKSKQEQVKDVIHALPLSRKQKDALYLSFGYAESGLWNVPW